MKQDETSTNGVATPVEEPLGGAATTTDGGRCASMSARRDGPVEVEKRLGESSFIASVFDRFDSAGICYALLRDGDRNTSSSERTEDRQVRVKEIDLLVKRTDWPRLCDLATAEGFCEQRPRVVRPLKRSLVRYQNGILIKLDIHLEMVSRGLVYMDAGEMLARRQQRKGVWCLASRDQAAHLACHAILDSRRVAPKYVEQLTLLLKEHGKNQQIESDLKRFGSDIIWRAMLDDFALLRDNQAECETLRQAAVRQIVRKSLGNRARWTWREIDRRWARIRGRRGAVVAVLGPDGVGKSTLLKNLTERIRSYHYKTEVVYMGPGGQSILPVGAARRVIGRPGEVSGKMSWRVVAWARWVMYLSVLAFEFSARWLFRVRPARRKAEVTLCDRYLYDIAVGYKNRVSNQLLGLRLAFCQIYPRPHATLLLTAPPETVVGRKDQLTRDAADEVSKAYDRAAERFYMVKIDARQTPDEVVDQVIEELWPLLFCGNPRSHRVFSKRTSVRP